MPTVDEIKKELQALPPKKVIELALKLVRFKKENKELISYLLFDAGDQAGYIETLRFQIDEMMSQIERGPSATVKTQLRAITRMIGRQIRYMANKEAAAELYLHFCETLLSHPSKLSEVPSAKTIYHQQLKKLNKIVPALNDDLQYDIQQRVTSLESPEQPTKKFSRWWRGKRGA